MMEAWALCVVATSEVLLHGKKTVAIGRYVDDFSEVGFSRGKLRDDPYLSRSHVSRVGIYYHTSIRKSLDHQTQRQRETKIFVSTRIDVFLWL
jgi:hypothetical protein